ncbi:MAG: NAD-dependent epimerase/dehydratase family protein [Planctomycetota bacterium]|nr:MAG: NAD-dependent epimerase/dehydratase family protein [Planctomycetota bacterium]
MKAVVTGGGGFLGRAIVEGLLARGDEVTSISRGAYPELQALGVRTVRADLADAGALRAAIAGADTVFHAAAKAGVWGPRDEYFRTNVEGTRHVIEACRAHGVPRLVYTSSPSVCFDGADHVNAGNDLPYARRFLAHYPASKARAEALVLAANSPELATCALRPHLIFGPRDPHLVPRLLDRAKKGRLAIVGDGTNEVSLTYVDNAANAHLQAAESLAPGARHAGKAYFIGQAQPVALWTWIDELLASQGLGPVTRRVSAQTARRVGAALELAWRALHLPGEPPMTRFVAAQLSTSHTYDLAPARDDFGYREDVSLAEGTRRTLASLG